MTCNIESCVKKVVSHGLCDTHRKRVERHGNVTKGFPKNWGQAKNHPLYSIWKGIRRRCKDKKYKSYMDYGGRGITLCERWNNFWNFVDDMGEKPGSIYQIERINNNLGYFPENCRWATPKEQQRNRRDTVLSQELANEIRRRYKFGDRMCDIAKSLNLKYHNVESVVRGLCWT